MGERERYVTKKLHTEYTFPVTVPKVCTVQDYRSINFIPYMLTDSGEAIEAPANTTFDHGDVVILQCGHVKGHVDNIKLHAYHCNPSGEHFVQGSLFITCEYTYSSYSSFYHNNL